MNAVEWIETNQYTLVISQVYIVFINWYNYMTLHQRGEEFTDPSVGSREDFSGDEEMPCFQLDSLSLSNHHFSWNI